MTKLINELFEEMYCETEDHSYGLIPVLKPGYLSYAVVEIVEEGPDGCVVRVQEGDSSYTCFQSNAELLPTSAEPLVIKMVELSAQLRKETRTT